MADIYDIYKKIETLLAKVRDLHQSQADVGYRQELATLSTNLDTCITNVATAQAAVPSNTHKAKGNP